MQYKLFMYSIPVAFRASLALPALLLIAAEADAAGQIGVQIFDRDGEAVPEVVVYARQLDATTPLEAPAAAVRMNQHNETFDPHILVVETGTRIEFPNDDQVRHHVYSFSSAKRFDFSIDSGDVPESLVFDVAGTVTLGCNVHDGMLAYIQVVDTPAFTKTDGDGVAVLSGLEPGQYELNIWTPRLARKKLPETRIVVVEPDNAVRSQYRLEDKLYPAHIHSETSLRWRNAY